MEPAGTLYLGLVLTHLLGEGGAVRVLCEPGRRLTFSCLYDYEKQTQISQLSVQWRSPGNELLCHYIKHKSFQNCSAGYGLSYRPGSIRLTIQLVTPRDLGTHVCSVSKRHEFSDYSVRLDSVAESVTAAPTGGVRQSGLVWSLVVLQAVACLFVCLCVG